MKMAYYLSHTDYPIWQVIHNGNGPVSVTIDTNGMIKVLPSKTAEEVVAREKGLHKGYDRFQTLLSQLEIHGAGVSHEDTNHKVFERDVKGTTPSSSNTQNVAFVSTDNTSSTNDVSTAYSVSFPSVLKSQKEGSSSYTDEVIHSFFANQSRHFARECRAKVNQDSKRRDVRYNGNKTRENVRRHAYQDDSKALVTIDGEDIDWSGHVEEDA
nr:hypothetical protein [Tanacetum cinerariifolium]